MQRASAPSLRRGPSVDDMLLTTAIGTSAGERPSSPATSIAFNLASVTLSSSGGSSPSSSSWTTQPLSPPLSPNNVVTAAELAAQLAAGTPPLLVIDVRPLRAFEHCRVRGSFAVKVTNGYGQRRLRPSSPLAGGRGIGHDRDAALRSVFLSEEGVAAFRNRAGRAAVLVDDRGPHNVNAAPLTVDAARLLYMDLIDDKLLAGVFILAEGFETFARTYPAWCDSGRSPVLADLGAPSIQIDFGDEGNGDGRGGFGGGSDADVARRMTPDDRGSSVASRPQALGLLKVHGNGRGFGDSDDMEDDDLRSASLDSLVLPMTSTNHLSPASAPRPASSTSSRLQQRHNRRLPGLIPLAVPAATDVKPVRIEAPSYRFLQPSAVLPWLWMGGDADAADLQKMRALGIRYIVNVARECSNHHEALHEFEYKHIAADDQIESPEEFEQEVSEACRFIAQARHNNNGKVFVHCRAGISRSATVVIAYLVQEEHWALREAIDHVRSVRPSVAPNLGFLVMLMSIERRVHGSDSLTSSTSQPSLAALDSDAMSIVLPTEPIRSPRGGSYPDSPKAAASSPVLRSSVRSP